ncbi:membrane protein [Amylibacter ulvae]|uniref:Membrane protein n=1 Tax=Paramylibacter ulvae TaxID=1651968 RepID=A0ABQ3D044_9RHOB|nr:DMT family transporter [Amylibacter ulvae]GHA51937.1 membrane protein [Amylibacter ulvae]
MRIFTLISITMIAFAANSVLNRLALVEPQIGPFSFALIRLIAGAVILWGILALRGQAGRHSFRPNILSVFGLTLYALGFSYAYVTLDAGLGALLLFGGVQLTMFIGAAVLGKMPKPLQWMGAFIGFAGLAYLLNPSNSVIDPLGAFFMLLAAFGWGVYTLVGQRVANAHVAAAQSFLFAIPIALVVWMFSTGEMITPYGVFLAILSGAIFSGLGYLLWFSVLPQITTITAAVAQLSVPIIAMLGGMVFLSEPFTIQFAVASVLVLGGITLSIWAGR